MTRRYNIRHEKGMRPESGFTLIEIVVVLVLLGVIATFSSLFLVTGIEGYLSSREASKAALKARVTLNRISLELRDINDIPSAPVTNTSITYTSDTLPGTRVTKFSGGNLYISVDGTDYMLLDNVSNPALTATYDDLDNDSSNGNEVAYIDVGFTISNIPSAFDVRIYPRNLVQQP